MSESTQRRVLSGRDFDQLVFVAVPAFGYELRSFIQRCIWVGPQDASFSAKHSWQCICGTCIWLFFSALNVFSSEIA